MARFPRASRTQLTAAALLLLSTAAVSGACSRGRAESPGDSNRAPQELLLLTGPRGGAYSPLGHALADIYNARVPGVRVTAASTEGPEGAAANAPAVEGGKADLAFSRADLAYQVFRAASEQTGSGPRLRSIAVLYTNAVHLVVRRASGITRGVEMRGRRVQVADEAGESALSRMVVEGHGLSLNDVDGVGPARNGIARLKSGELDVRIFASAYPLAGIDDVGPASALGLLSLEPEVVDRLRSRFPFFKPAVIPMGTYKGQTEDVETVGIDGLLLCRDTMPESVVYDLTRTLFEALPELSRVERAARMINVVNAPATPVPLHPGAARYYRERDLFR